MQLKKVRVNDIITAKYQMLQVPACPVGRRRGVRFNTLKGTFGTATKAFDSLACSIRMNGLLCPPSATSKGSKYVLAFGHRRLEVENAL